MTPCVWCWAVDNGKNTFIVFYRQIVDGFPSGEHLAVMQNIRNIIVGDKII